MQLESRSRLLHLARSKRRPRPSVACWRSAVGALLALLAGAQAAAQGECLLNDTGTMGDPQDCAGSAFEAFACGQVTENCEDEVGTECPKRAYGGFFTCHAPILPEDPDFEVVSELDGTFTVRMAFDVFVPWMFESNDGDGEQDNLNDVFTGLWWNGATTATWPAGQSFPAGSTAFAHTHPTRARAGRSQPQSSSNDINAADRVGYPVYTVSPQGIWKYDPATGKVTLEAPSNWSKEAERRCPDHRCREMIQ